MSNKIIIIGDTHFYKYQDFSYIKENGVNSRLDTSLEAFEEILQYGRDNGIDNYIHLGDVFEKKSVVDKDTFCYVKDLLNDYGFGDGNYGKKMYILVGNHDCNYPHTYPNTVESIWLPDIEIIDTSRIEVICEKRVLLMPYKKREDLPVDQLLNTGEFDIICTHLDINGLSYTGCPGIVDQVNPNVFKDKLVFNGHIHKHQVMGNIVNLGSMLQTTMGERDYTNCFCVLNTDIMKYEFISLSEYPKFILEDVSEKEDSEVFDLLDIIDPSYNYVTLIVRPDQVSWIKKEYPEVKIRMNQIITKERLKVKTQDSGKDICINWLKSFVSNEIEQNNRIKFLEELLVEEVE